MSFGANFPVITIPNSSQVWILSWNANRLLGICRMHGFLINWLISDFDDSIGLFSYTIISSLASFPSYWSSITSTPPWIGYPIEKFCPGAITNWGGWASRLAITHEIFLYMKTVQNLLDLFLGRSMNSRKFSISSNLVWLEYCRTYALVCMHIRTKKMFVIFGLSFWFFPE